MPGVRRNASSAACAQLPLQIVLKAVNLQIAPNAHTSGHSANSRTMAGAPIELRLLQCQARRMAQAKEQLDEGTVLPRDEFLGNRVDLRILVGQPKRRIGKIEKFSLVFLFFNATATT